MRSPTDCASARRSLHLWQRPGGRLRPTVSPRGGPNRRGSMSRRSMIVALFAVLALSALGVLVARSIPNAVFPEFVFHRAIILADSAELPPQQMLVAVTRPLEEAAYNVAGTTLVRSTTTSGSAEIDVTFAENTDPVATYGLLGAALAEA